MGRKARLTVDYFPHYIGDGKKTFTITEKYGNDGYATWWKILELLAKTDNHYLDLSTEAEIMFVASFCKVSESLLIDIVSDIVKLEEIDAELWESRIVWNQKFIESIQFAYFKRNNPCIDRNGLIDMLTAKGRLKAMKKQKTGKTNDLEPENEKVYRFDFKKGLLNAGAETSLIHQWLQVRAKKRASNTEIALRGFLKEVEKSGLNINEVLTKCIERSWMGFEAKYLENGKQQQTSGNTTTSAKPTFDGKLEEQRYRIINEAQGEIESSQPGVERNGFEDIQHEEVK